MKEIMSSFVSGLLFGGGLILSGMADPMTVLGFFDVAGQWNPALAFVMAGGLAVTWLGYRVVFRRTRPFFSPAFLLPTARGVDIRLIVGSGLFGLGWGMAGYCPGPVLVAAGGGLPAALIFVAAMVVGMLAWKLVSWRLSTCPFRIVSKGG